MIRRGFWLAAGAVLGVTGYRRLLRLARVLTVPPAAGIPSLPGTGPTAGPQMLAPPAPRRSYAARAVAAARFVRDVRDGMAEYRELHRDEPDPAGRGHTLEGQSYLDSSAASQQGRREP
jgi:hypothetical protein